MGGMWDPDLWSRLAVALVGALFGALSAGYIPEWLFGPRLEVVRLSRHGQYVRIVVRNSGRRAATGAVGKLTLWPITKDSLLGTRSEVLELRRHKRADDNWRSFNDVFLATEFAETGIDREGLHWAASPSSAMININPKCEEILHLAYIEPGEIKIASEDVRTSRARLKIGPRFEYWGKVEVSASNTVPARPLYFNIPANLKPDSEEARFEQTVAMDRIPGGLSQKSILKGRY